MMRSAEEWAKEVFNQWHDGDYGEPVLEMGKRQLVEGMTKFAKDYAYEVGETMREEAILTVAAYRGRTETGLTRGASPLDKARKALVAAIRQIEVKTP